MRMSLKKWLDNARSLSLAQSITPAVLAVVLALGQSGFHWYDALLAVLGVACAHLSLNLADDYFDYKVDVLGDRDKVVRKGFRAMMVKYPYLTDGSQTLRSTARAIASFALVALCFGVFICLDRALPFSGQEPVYFWGENGLWWIPAIVLACAFLGVFYSAPPLKLAYRGLGEWVIGIIFGPLVMMGVYYASCAQMSLHVVLLSIPVGLLVLNILFTHSFIDMEGDKECNKMTFARLVGSVRGNLVCSALFIFVPFLLVIAGVCLKLLPAWYLFVLLVLPRGAWLFYSLVEFTKGRMMEVEKPHKWLGAMPSWDKYRAAHIDWFMVRWLGARNLLTGFCFILIIVSLALFIF